MDTLHVSFPPAMPACVAAQVYSGRSSAVRDAVWTLLRADQHWQTEAMVAATLLDSIGDTDAAGVSPAVGTWLRTVRCHRPPAPDEPRG